MHVSMHIDVLMSSFIGFSPLSLHNNFCLCQVEAIVQDATAQGSISTFDALNIRLENQV